MCDVFHGFPEWLQKDIEDSFEYKAAVEEGNGSDVVKSEVAEESTSESLADLADEESDLPF